MFNHECLELRNFMEDDVNFNAISLKDDLLLFNPPSKEMFAENGARVLYYCSDSRQTFNECQTIINFKIHSKSKNQPIPDVDQEILRHMNCCNFDIKRATESIKEHKKFMSNVFPMHVSQTVFKMLK
jgi:hypothetical protein